MEFAATIPAKFRPRNGTTSLPVQASDAGTVPDEIIDWPKYGFAVPIAQWFRNDLAGFARDLLLSDTCRQRGSSTSGTSSDYSSRINAAGIWISNSGRFCRSSSGAAASSTRGLASLKHQAAAPLRRNFHPVTRPAGPSACRAKRTEDNG